MSEYSCDTESDRADDDTSEAGACMTSPAELTAPLELLAAIPEPISSVVFGQEFPDGISALVNRVAQQGWRVFEEACARASEELRQLISQMRASGETGAAISESIAAAEELLRALDQVSEWSRAFADQLESEAFHILTSQLESAFFGAMLVAQFYSVLTTPGGAVAGAVVLERGRSTFLQMMRGYVQRAMAEGAAATARRAGSAGAQWAGGMARAAAGGAGLMTAVNVTSQITAHALLGQPVGVDWTMAGGAAAMGAGAGAGGFVAGRVLGSVFPRAQESLGGRLAVRGAEGLAGLFAGAAVTAAMTGEFHMGWGMLANGLAGGAVGAWAGGRAAPGGEWGRHSGESRGFTPGAMPDRGRGEVSAAPAGRPPSMNPSEPASPGTPGVEAPVVPVVTETAGDNAGAVVLDANGIPNAPFVPGDYVTIGSERPASTAGQGHSTSSTTAGGDRPSQVRTDTPSNTAVGVNRSATGGPGTGVSASNGGRPPHLGDLAEPGHATSAELHPAAGRSPDLKPQGSDGAEQLPASTDGKVPESPGHTPDPGAVSPHAGESVDTTTSDRSAVTPEADTGPVRDGALALNANGIPNGPFDTAEHGPVHADRAVGALRETLDGGGEPPVTDYTKAGSDRLTSTASTHDNTPESLRSDLDPDAVSPPPSESVDEPGHSVAAQDMPGMREGTPIATEGDKHAAVKRAALKERVELAQAELNKARSEASRRRDEEQWQAAVDHAAEVRAAQQRRDEQMSAATGEKEARRRTQAEKAVWAEYHERVHAAEARRDTRVRTAEQQYETAVAKHHTAYRDALAELVAVADNQGKEPLATPDEKKAEPSREDTGEALDETGKDDRKAAQLGEKLAALPTADPSMKADLTAEQQAQFKATAKEALALYRLRREELAAETWELRRTVMERGDEVESLLRYIDAMREGTTMTPRWNQIEAFLLAEHGFMRQMGTGQGKSIVGALDALWQLSRGEPVELASGRSMRVHHVITTTEVLANDGIRQFGSMFRSLGYDIARWDPHNPPAEPQRPTVYYMTYDERATAELFDRPPPGNTATIDEADAVLVHNQTVHYQSDGQRERASEVEAAEVYRVRDFLRGVLADRELTSADLRARPEASLETASRMWEQRTGRSFTAEETEMARAFLDVKAGRLKLNRDFQMFDGKIQILDEYGKPRSDPKIGTESRWFGGRHKMVEAMFGVEVYSDGTGSKQVTVENVLGGYRRLSLMSGTLERTAAEIKQNFPVQGGLARVEDFGRSKLVGEKDRIFLTEPDKLKAAVARVAELQAEGRPVLVISPFNDLAHKFSLMLAKEGIEHNAIDARWFAEHRDNNAAEEHLLSIKDEAGARGTVTIGTGMLGRGFDVSITDEVNRLGGVHMEGLGRSPTNPDEDHQWAARAGRNGRNGSYSFNVAVTDRLYNHIPHHGARIAITHYRTAVANHADATAAYTEAARTTSESPATQPTQDSSEPLQAARAKVAAMHADLVAAEREIRSLTPQLQNAAAGHAYQDRMMRRAHQAHAPPTADDPATVSTPWTQVGTAPHTGHTTVDTTHPGAGTAQPHLDRGRFARLTGWLGIPHSIQDAAANTLFGDAGDDDPLSRLLHRAGLSPAAVEALNQHLDHAAPAAVARTTDLTNEHALNQLIPQRNRLAAELEWDDEHVAGVEGMRRVEDAVTETRNTLAAILDVPAADVNTATAREVLADSITRTLSFPTEAVTDSTPAAEPVVTAASSLLATTALLDLVVAIDHVNSISRHPMPRRGNATDDPRSIGGRQQEGSSTPSINAPAVEQTLARQRGIDADARAMVPRASAAAPTANPLGRRPGTATLAANRTPVAVGVAPTPWSQRITAGVESARTTAAAPPPAARGTTDTRPAHTTNNLGDSRDSAPTNGPTNTSPTENGTPPKPGSTGNNPPTPPGSGQVGGASFDPPPKPTGFTSFPAWFQAVRNHYELSVEQLAGLMKRGTDEVIGMESGNQRPDVQYLRDFGNALAPLGFRNHLLRAAVNHFEHPKKVLYKLYDDFTRRWFRKLQHSPKTTIFLEAARGRDLVRNLEKLNEMFRDLADEVFADDPAFFEEALEIMGEHREYVAWAGQMVPGPNAGREELAKSIRHKILRNVSLAFMDGALCFEGALNYGLKSVNQGKLKPEKLRQVLRNSTALVAALASLHDELEIRRIAHLTGEVEKAKELQYPTYTVADIVNGAFPIAPDKIKTVGEGDKAEYRFVASSVSDLVDSPTETCPAHRQTDESDDKHRLNDIFWRLLVSVYSISRNHPLHGEGPVLGVEPADWGRSGPFVGVRGASRHPKFDRTQSLRRREVEMALQRAGRSRDATELGALRETAQQLDRAASRELAHLLDTALTTSTNPSGRGETDTEPDDTACALEAALRLYDLQTLLGNQWTKNIPRVRPDDTRVPPSAWSPLLGGHGARLSGSGKAGHHQVLDFVLGAHENQPDPRTTKHHTDYHGRVAVVMDKEFNEKERTYSAHTYLVVNWHGTPLVIDPHRYEHPIRFDPHDTAETVHAVRVVKLHTDGTPDDPFITDPHQPLRTRTADQLAHRHDGMPDLTGTPPNDTTPTAFDKLWQRHSKAVRTKIARGCSDPALLDRLVDEVRELARNRMSLRDQDTDLDAWLIGLASKVADDPGDRAHRAHPEPTATFPPAENAPAAMSGRPLPTGAEDVPRAMFVDPASVRSPEKIVVDSSDELDRLFGFIEADPERISRHVRWDLRSKAFTYPLPDGGTGTITLRMDADPSARVAMRVRLGSGDDAIDLAANTPVVTALHNIAWLVEIIRVDNQQRTGMPRRWDPADPTTLTLDQAGRFAELRCLVGMREQAVADPRDIDRAGTVHELRPALDDALENLVTELGLRPGVRHAATLMTVLNAWDPSRLADRLRALMPELSPAPDTRFGSFFLESKTREGERLWRTLGRGSSVGEFKVDPIGDGLRRSDRPLEYRELLCQIDDDHLFITRGRASWDPTEGEFVFVDGQNKRVRMLVWMVPDLPLAGMADAAVVCMDLAADDVYHVFVSPETRVEDASRVVADALGQIRHSRQRPDPIGRRAVHMTKEIAGRFGQMGAVLGHLDRAVSGSRPELAAGLRKDLLDLVADVRRQLQYTSGLDPVECLAGQDPLLADRVADVMFRFGPRQTVAPRSVRDDEYRVYDVGDFRGDARPDELPDLTVEELRTHIAKDLRLFTDDRIRWVRDHFEFDDGVAARHVHLGVDNIGNVRSNTVASWGRDHRHYHIRVSPRTDPEDVSRAVKGALDLLVEYESNTSEDTLGRYERGQLRFAVEKLAAALAGEQQGAVQALGRKLWVLAAALGMRPTDPGFADRMEILSEYDADLAAQFNALISQLDDNRVPLGLDYRTRPPSVLSVDLPSIQSNAALLLGRRKQGIVGDVSDVAPVDCARAMIDGGVRELRASLPTALQLREAGIEQPIMVTGLAIDAYVAGAAINADLTIGVSSITQLRVVAETAERLGKVAKVAVEVDTGRHTGGVAVPQFESMLDEIGNTPATRLRAVYTVLAYEDDPWHAMNDIQAARFSEVRRTTRSWHEDLPEAQRGDLVFHIAGDAMVVRPELSETSAARLGGPLYGFLPKLPGVPLQHSLALWTRLNYIQDVLPDEGFGYGGKPKNPPQELTVGWSGPAGNGDLFQWEWGRSAKQPYVSVSGMRLPVCGPAPMDQFPVLIASDQKPKLREGDVVVVAGPGADGESTFDQQAAVLGKLPAHLLSVPPGRFMTAISGNSDFRAYRIFHRRSVDPHLASAHATIDTDGITNNILVNLDRLSEKVRSTGQPLVVPEVMVVLKAEGYGNGAAIVARAANKAGVHIFGVTILEEALELRRKGMADRLVSWQNNIRSDFAAAIAKDVSIGVSSVEVLRAVAEAASVAKPAKVHLFMNTGMNREGFTLGKLEQLIPDLIEEIERGQIVLEGVMTHLDTDSPDKWPKQNEVFDKAVERLAEVGLYPELQSVFGSSSIDENAPGDKLRTLVRMGIVNSGIPVDFTPNPELRHVVTVRSRVAQVFEVPKDEAVGPRYLQKEPWKTRRDTRIGLIPVGTGDLPLPRPKVSEESDEGGYDVWIDGDRYPVVAQGVDFMLIDLGPESPISENTDVVLLGSGLNGEPTLLEWADRGGGHFMAIFGPNISVHATGDEPDSPDVSS